MSFKRQARKGLAGKAAVARRFTAELDQLGLEEFVEIRHQAGCKFPDGGVCTCEPDVVGKPGVNLGAVGVLVGAQRYIETLRLLGEKYRSLTGLGVERDIQSLVEAFTPICEALKTLAVGDALLPGGKGV